MENKNCLSAIKSKYRNLTKKERQLADYMLENFEAVVPMSTAELARNAGAVLYILLMRAIGFVGRFVYPALYKLCRNNENTVSLIGFLYV